MPFYEQPRQGVNVSGIQAKDRAKPVRRERGNHYIRMVAACWTIYALWPDALKLVIWMGAVDGPLVGVLFLSYAYLGRRYLPPAYRSGVFWTCAMVLSGALYLALGGYAFLTSLD